MEKRLLIAFALSALIFMVWSAVVAPPPRPQQQPPATAAGDAPAPTAAPTATPEGPPATAPVGEELAPVEEIAAASEREVVLENDAVRVALTNRGARITSIVLKEYEDDEGNALDLVQKKAGPAHTLPLQLVDADGADERLYEVEASSGEATFTWAGGGQRRTKTVRLPEQGYGVGVEVGVMGAEPLPALSLGTGMRDIGASERENRFATWGDAIIGRAGEIERIKRGKVDGRRELATPELAFAGFEDTYFLNVLRPANGDDVTSVRMVAHVVPPEAPDGDEERVLEILLELGDGALSGELFAAPKEYDLLQAVDAGVEETLDFGIFHPISVFFLKAMRWIYGWVGNWGVAIILLTVAIRLVLFPLMHTSTVSMRRMQKIQPKVKALQEKYKKAKTDPQARAKMNQETMELYRTEGVNPMGGCLPLLVQLPILWALYTLFAHAIELRHAPFIFWIQDLSAKDPLYITPVLMTATMWLQQRLAPQVGDPQQQRIFRLMPLVFGIMFLGFPAGLVLYWLTNNVLTIIQQEITLHLLGERSRPRRSPARKA